MIYRKFITMTCISMTTLLGGMSCFAGMTHDELLKIVNDPNHDFYLSWYCRDIKDPSVQARVTGLATPTTGKPDHLYVTVHKDFLDQILPGDFGVPDGWLSAAMGGGQYMVHDMSNICEYQGNTIHCATGVRISVTINLDDYDPAQETVKGAMRNDFSEYSMTCKLGGLKDPFDP